MMMEEINTLLELNNQVLRDHLTGLGIIVSVLIVVFSILAIVIPYLQLSQFLKLKKDIAQKNREQNEAINALRNDLMREAADVYMFLLSSAMRFLTESKNLSKDTAHCIAIADNALVFSVGLSPERRNHNLEEVASRLRDIDNFLKNNNMSLQSCVREHSIEIRFKKHIDQIPNSTSAKNDALTIQELLLGSN